MITILFMFSGSGSGQQGKNLTVQINVMLEEMHRQMNPSSFSSQQKQTHFFIVISMNNVSFQKLSCAYV